MTGMTDDTRVTQDRFSLMLNKVPEVTVYFWVFLAAILALVAYLAVSKTDIDAEPAES